MWILAENRNKDFVPSCFGIIWKNKTSEICCLFNNVACIKYPVIPLFQLYTWMYSAIMGTLTIQQENRCDMRWIPVESAFRCLKPEDALETFSFFF